MFCVVLDFWNGVSSILSTTFTCIDYMYKYTKILETPCKILEDSLSDTVSATIKIFKKFHKSSIYYRTVVVHWGIHGFLFFLVTQCIICVCACVYVLVFCL